MSFRKRNVLLSTSQLAHKAPPAQSEKYPAPGLRPSPLDGRLTTSTGTSSLDHLLAGHAGLPMGTSLLIEEQGTTDFSGTVLQYYAAEGLVQGHQVHTLGLTRFWKNGLPGIADPEKIKPARIEMGEMKIAWRYKAYKSQPVPRQSTRDGSNATPFCHSFDLKKRLALTSCKGSLQPLPDTCMPLGKSPLNSAIKHLQSSLANSNPATIHRVVIAGLLSPATYPPACCRPSEVLRFLHALRALLRQYSGQLTALVTISLSLFPRATGLTRWMELLCDGVIELVPFAPNTAVAFTSVFDMTESQEDHCQGMLMVHTLPIHHEKGGGGGQTFFRENLSFSLSASKGLVIKPYSLPPLGEDTQRQKSPASSSQDCLDF